MYTQQFLSDFHNRIATNSDLLIYPMYIKRFE